MNNVNKVKEKDNNKENNIILRKNNPTIKKYKVGEKFEK